MGIDETLKKVTQICSLLNKELDSIIKDSLSVDLTLPSYEDVKSRKVLYTKYAEVINLNNRIGTSLLTSHKLLLTLKELRQEVSNNKAIQFSVIVVYKDRITREIDSLTEKIKVVTDFKQSLEQTLRFYQSLQYILSSYRMED